MPEQDQDAPELNKTQVEFKLVIPSGHDSSEVVKPSKQAFYLPSSPVSPQRAAILGRVGSPPVHPVRGNQFNATGLFQSSIQRVAVISLIPYQSLWVPARKTMMQGLVNQGHFMRRSASNPQCDRKTMALRNCHDLGPFASLCLTNSSAPFFALEKEPSINVSLRSIPPRVCISATMARRRFFRVPSLIHSPNRRWQVWYAGNSPGKSFHRAPVRNIQRMPSSTSRLLRLGRPLRPGPLLPWDNKGSMISHC